MSATPVEKLRSICMSLPDVEERLSHGEPAWFITKGKQFVSVDDHHHGACALASNVGEGQSESASSSSKDARRRRTGPVRRGGGRSWGRRWPF